MSGNLYKSFLVFSFCTLLLNCGGSSKSLFYNDNYSIAKRNDYKLVVLPSPDSNGVYFDEALSYEFEDISSNLSIESMKNLRENIIDNVDFRILLNKASSLQYPDTAITYIPNLLEVLTEDEFILMRRFLNDPDLVLFPKFLFSRYSREFVYAGAFCRLFDMHNGELIYDDVTVVPIPASELEYEDALYYPLAAGIKSDFQMLFWIPFIEGDSTRIIER